jgi:hypothetical protein
LIRTTTVGLIALVALAGCVSTSGRRSLPKYDADTEYFVPTLRGTLSRTHAAIQGRTYYFQTASRRPCYSFHVPGTWELDREAAMLRRIDGGGMVGVLVFSLEETGSESHEQAIRIAAERSAKIYADVMGDAAWTLDRHPSIRDAWVWQVPDSVRAAQQRPGTTTSIVPRYFMPVGDHWIAQFTVGSPADLDGEAFVDDVLRSFAMTRAPRCYEDRLRELGGIR